MYRQLICAGRMGGSNRVLDKPHRESNDLALPAKLSRLTYNGKCFPVFPSCLAKIILRINAVLYDPFWER